VVSGGSHGAARGVQVQRDNLVEPRRPRDLQRNVYPDRQTGVGCDEDAAARRVDAAAEPEADLPAFCTQPISNSCGRQGSGPGAAGTPVLALKNAVADPIDDFRENATSCAGDAATGE